MRQTVKVHIACSVDSYGRHIILILTFSSPSALPPEMNSWLAEMDIISNSQVEELLRTGLGRPPGSSSPDTMRDTANCEGQS